MKSKTYYFPDPEHEAAFLATEMLSALTLQELAAIGTLTRMTKFAIFDWRQMNAIFRVIFHIYISWDPRRNFARSKQVFRGRQIMPNNEMEAKEE